MLDLYPPGPVNVADDLTAPGSSYKRRAQVAFISLLLFIALYISLTGWFAWTAYNYFHNAMNADQGAFIAYGLGAAAAFLSLFLFKALFFINRGGESNDLEVNEKEQPQLFEFLYRLADDAGAPRPHRVFLSGRVNAAVFYDLTLLNLIIPSKKNLEIGLALVNGLNLGELKAVLAHEFGHFKQGSMAVGRWVYVAQQIATHIIHQRDILDRFLMGLSHFDIRIAWVGWILRLIVWALRAILDTAFSLVVIAQRSLSREMEFHADLVSVSLTGSDALIHALHRLHAADDAWGRALEVAGQELSAGRAVNDIFVIQKVVTQRMQDILDDENYDSPPTLPDFNREQHRVFDEDEVHPPQMWSTHPPNSAREENAKKQYIAAKIDERPAWEIFRNAQQLREQMTAHILSASPDSEKLPKSAMTETVANVNKLYSKATYERRYRGVYMGRSPVREFETAAESFSDTSIGSDMAGAYDSLYPSDLPDKLEHWRNLEEERSNLRALYDGNLTSPDSVIRHRGVIMKRRQLPAAIQELRAECDVARRSLSDHDKLVRSVNNVAAEQLGNGWREYHNGLVALLHYADHSEANLNDIHGRLGNLWSVVMADGKVSRSEVKELLVVAHDLHSVLLGIANSRNDIVLGSDVAERMSVANWNETLAEDFTLPEPTKDNLGEWLGVVENWINYFADALGSLRLESLEALLAAEAAIETSIREGKSLGAATTAASVPQGYTTLLPNTERKLQTRLGVWDRFQTADGFVPGFARFAVAATIVGGLLGVGVYTSGTASVTVYNGLATTVEVVADGDSLVVAPNSTGTFAPAAKSNLQIEAYASDGSTIEEMQVDASNSLAEYVYNIGSAAPMIEWTATYGSVKERPPVYLGTPTWFQTRADHIFEEAPEEIRGSSDGGRRTVLSGFGDIDPQYLENYVEVEYSLDKTIRAHAKWDHPNSKNTMIWLAIASEEDYFGEILRFRLNRNDSEILARRFEQDTAIDEVAAAQVCEHHATRAQSQPTNLSWSYLSVRCIEDQAAQSSAFIKAYGEQPEHAWFAGAAGYSYAERSEWALAEEALLFAYEKLPAMRPSYADTLSRIRRFRSGIESADLAQFAAVSRRLETYLMLESDQPVDVPVFVAFQSLAHGDLQSAIDEAREVGAYSDEILRLAAASDGASAELVRAASELTADRGIDTNTLWIALGFAARHKLPSDDLLAQAETNVDDGAELLRDFHALLVTSPLNIQRAEQLLVGTGPETRGRALAMATVALGEKTPADWRSAAKRMLFATERPYFQ